MNHELCVAEEVEKDPCPIFGTPASGADRSKDWPVVALGTPASR